MEKNHKAKQMKKKKERVLEYPRVLMSGLCRPQNRLPRVDSVRLQLFSPTRRCLSASSFCSRHCRNFDASNMTRSHRPTLNLPSLFAEAVFFSLVSPGSETMVKVFMCARDFLNSYWLSRYTTIHTDRCLLLLLLLLFLSSQIFIYFFLLTETKRKGTQR